jgi:dihydroxy-acid dehydratase
VKTGDIISLDVPARTLSLLVDNSELEARRQAAGPLKQTPSRGYAKLFHEQVTQAPEGADFTFLQGVDKS